MSENKFYFWRALKVGNYGDFGLLCVHPFWIIDGKAFVKAQFLPGLNSKILPDILENNCYEFNEWQDQKVSSDDLLSKICEIRESFSSKTFSY